MKAALIGYGRFGKHFLKAIESIKDTEISWICTRSSPVSIDGNYNTTTNFNDVLNDHVTEAILIVTPAISHFDLAKKALEAKKHVFIEKPAVLSSKDAEELDQLAEKNKVICMAGHIQLFNEGIQKLKEDIDNQHFGKIKRITINHHSSGPVRKDVNAIWDILPHAYSILTYFFNDPKTITAQGTVDESTNDVGTISATVKYKELTANLSGSWSHPYKETKVMIIGDKKSAEYDDMEKTLTYFDQKENKETKKFKKLPLTTELETFFDCIKQQKQPLTDMKHALSVTKLLENTQQSVDANGKEITVSK